LAIRAAGLSTGRPANVPSCGSASTAAEASGGPLLAPC
jgi:hypothetical protein